MCLRVNRLIFWYLSIDDINSPSITQSPKGSAATWLLLGPQFIIAHLFIGTSIWGVPLVCRPVSILGLFYVCFVGLLKSVVAAVTGPRLVLFFWTTRIETKITTKTINQNFTCAIFVYNKITYTNYPSCITRISIEGNRP